MSFLYFLEDLRNPVLDFFFSLITTLGEETIFMAVGMIVFWCVDKYKGYFLLYTGFLGTAINQFLKIACRIPRPWVIDPDFTTVGNSQEGAGGYSFPSGHTQTAVGLYGGIARMSKNLWLRIGMIALSLLIALSRMYLGVHTPADVLVSLLIATVLVFVAYPLIEKTQQKPVLMYWLLIPPLAVTIGLLLYLKLYPFPAEVYAEDAFTAAQKNGYTLLGCCLGMFAAYTADWKWLKFPTKAVWWAQILKILGGLLLVIAAKELLKAPLDRLFDGHLISRSVRYFIMVLLGGTVWPMSFKFFSRLGKGK